MVERLLFLGSFLVLRVTLMMFLVDLRKTVLVSILKAVQGKFLVDLKAIQAMFLVDLRRIVLVSILKEALMFLVDLKAVVVLQLVSMIQQACSAIRLSILSFQLNYPSYRSSPKVTQRSWVLVFSCLVLYWCC